MLWVGEWRMELNFGGVGTFLGNIFFLYILFMIKSLQYIDPIGEYMGISKL